MPRGASARTSLLVYCDVGGSGGFLRYVAGLFCSDNVPHDVDVDLICPPELLTKLPAFDSRVRVHVRKEISSPVRGVRYLWYLWGWPRLARLVMPDVIFFPSGRVRPTWSRRPVVTTFHNLLPFVDEEIGRYNAPSWRLRLNAWRRAQERSFRRSTGVIFLSNHSRDVIVGRGLNIGRSAVISHGVGEQFRCSERNYRSRESSTLLYVSSIHPYKNHCAVVRAVAGIRRTTGYDVRLEIIGTADADLIEQVQEAANREGVGEVVRIRPSADDGELFDAYSRADVFVFASSCETFGISLLEAMAMGMPIACSDRSGLRDLSGDYAVYFDPFDENSITRALLQLLESEPRRAMSGRGSAAAARSYTWRRSADETFSFIRELHRRGVK